MRLQFSGFTFDSSARDLFRGETGVHLSPKAFQLLLALIEARPTAVAKSTLQDLLWPSTFVAETNLAGLVNELRAALQDDPKESRFIRTVFGYGYSFCASAHELDDAEVTQQSVTPLRMSRMRTFSAIAASSCFRF